ncbi:ABC transporter ATP-binding protein [Streptococcus pneumoniae]|nr:ABC transporter ATP-binding protein [Streptococcus pneumoniae]
MKKENEYVILTTASLGVMIGIVFAIFLDFPVEYGISLGPKEIPYSTGKSKKIA